MAVGADINDERDGRVGGTVRASALRARGRLDARYFSNEGVAAYAKLDSLRSLGVELKQLGDLGSVWDPPRFARVWATQREEAIGYLRPYDVFEYLPLALQSLSTSRNTGIERLRVKAGQLLQTCSGRNLGPLTYADQHLAKFALSHDMIRIELPEEVDRFFVLAFLQSELGQALVRRDSSGSVISHLTVQDVERLQIPYLDEITRLSVARQMQNAAASRESARLSLSAAIADLEAAMPERRTDNRKSWTTRASRLQGRLDAAFYAPVVEQARRDVASAGGAPLNEIATASLLGRYKRYYVEPGHGRPIVSGRQILQTHPINLQYVSDRSFRDPDSYVVKYGTVIFGADGRAEGRQGWPALVTDERDGWLASNHVMRVHARDGVRPGAVWLALADARVQAQIKALSFGSVVDQTNPQDVECVVVPPVPEELADQAEAAWSALDEASETEKNAIGRLNTAIQELHSAAAPT